jgi:3',5'-cyclic AMP phosphodiesterase CpdA
MPIHLPALSRRQFLARGLTATAALLLSPRLLAASRKVDRDSWVLFSDTHIASNRAQVSREANMSDHLQQAVTEVLNLPERPAGAFLTGDLAYGSGESGDYAVLADLLKPLRQGGIPAHLALGNHDHRERFWEAFREVKAAKRPVADRQVALVRGRHANWFILDSLETTQATPGLLGSAQLEWLGKSLDANPKKPALILIHHNPGLNGGNMGLKDTFPLLGVIRPRKQVKAYIFGHTHSWNVEQDTSGIHLVNLPAVAYVFRETDPSGWVHARLGENSAELELRCFKPAHPKHGQRLKLEWRT